MSIEPGSVWRGLQEVQEGADPADVYARLVSDSIDPEEAAENDFHEHVENAHTFEECREKNASNGICFGTTCQYVGGGIRLQVDCPCTCHQGEEP